MSDTGTVVASGNSPTEPVGSGSGGVWTPDCWHSSPDALIAQARAQNEAGYQGVFASAGRGSQPPAYSPDHELQA
jgi:hypothetical protein